MKKLKLIMAFCALILGWSSASAYQTPVADGIYYLYNTACTDGNPGFMSTGNNYGFQVVIDNFGFPVKLISTGDGNYRFQFVHHEGYLADDGFMYSDGNTDRARTITIQDQGEGKYKLLNTNNSKEIEDWYGNVVGDGTGNRHNYLWQFLSKDERDAMVAGYTTSVKLAAATSMGMPASVDTESEFDEYLSTNYIGVDQSAKITNGTFDTSHNTEGWTTHNNDNRSFNIGWGNADPKTTPEVYEGAGYIDHTSVSVDKAGLYKVSVNATYRCGNNNNNNRIGDLGYDGSVAYLKANNSIAKISDWYSGKINGNGPGSPSEANSVYFAAGKYLTEVYVYVGDEKTIDISLHSHAFTWGGWLMFNNFKLTYYSDEVSDEDATTIIATATSLESKAMYASIKAALTDAKTTFNGARTIANYNALNTAIANATPSVTDYENLKNAIAKASSYTPIANVSTYSDAIAAAQAIYDDASVEDCSETINGLTTAKQTANVGDYTYVENNFQYAVSLGTWTKENAIDRRGQHWDGTTDGSTGSPYSEQSEGWAGGNWECSYSQNLSLPAGNYVFKVAGRKSSDDATLTLKVTNGNEVMGLVSDFPNGDTGKGITTAGVASFDEGTFANNGIGRGWQWRFVKFTLAEPATVNVAVTGAATPKYNWVGFCNPTVQTDKEENVALMEALVALNSAKTKATLTKSTNVGTGVFQYNEATNELLWGAYTTAKSNAEAYEFTSSSTASEVNALATELTTAITNYQSQSLNAPDAEKRYNVSIVEAGKAWNGNAITFIAGGRDDQGKYGVKYLAPANANLNQALKFTPVLGEPNTYKVSAIRVVDGSEQYLTTGKTYEGNNDQIRTTEDVTKAMLIKVEATSTANQFQLRNVAADKIIANNGNNDVYTAGSANFTIAEASQATVDMTIDANVKYATRIFPFTPTTWPNGVVAYSCATTDGDALVLEEVAQPVANVPYILYAENGSTGSVTDWGTAPSTEVVKAGMLNGVYEDTAAPVNSYVLQKINDKVGFYKVAEEKQPTVGAYHCYLTDGENAAHSAFFFGGAITGINQIDNGQLTIDNSLPVKRIVNGKLVIEKNGVKYNAAGAQVK